MHEQVAADRPHIVIKGAPLKDASLHRLVEEAGGYVVAEDDWRGSRAAGDTDVCVNKDPVTAIFEKYFYDEVSPRIQPSSDRDAWFQREIERGHVDGVLFYIPLEDDVRGLGLSRATCVSGIAVDTERRGARKRCATRRFRRKPSSKIVMAQKQLTSTVAASEGQKAWFASLRERVFETRAPYAIGQADMPFELFQAMDAPAIR